MDELIKKVISELNLDESAVKQSLGAVLKFLKDQTNGSVDFEAILAKLPGAKDLMKDQKAEAAVAEASSEAPAASGPSGIVGIVFSFLKAFGLLAILKQLLSTFFGDSAVQLLESVEDGAELTVVLEKVGVSRDQGIKIVQMMVTFMKDKLDGETVDKLVNNVPALKAFLSETKKEE